MCRWRFADDRLVAYLSRLLPTAAASQEALRRSRTEGRRKVAYAEPSQGQILPCELAQAEIHGMSASARRLLGRLSRENGREGGEGRQVDAYQDRRAGPMDLPVLENHWYTIRPKP